MIRFEGVSKIYSTEVVLKNINWEIKKGEKIGLVGSNGAGKSTQFKILIGEEDQTSGTIIKEGNPKIAHLKQELDCNLNYSVREELESSFKDIKIVALKLLEIEKKLKLLDKSFSTSFISYAEASAILLASKHKTFLSFAKLAA